MIRDKELDAYFKEAQGWDHDRIESIKTSEKRAWFVALASGFIAVCSVAAVLGLTPLKESIPYVVRVDNTTGVTDIVRMLKDDETDIDESMSRFFAQQYVKHREGYSKPLVNDYYTTVGAMSGGSEKVNYYNWFNPSNPLSPMVLYGSKVRVNVKIKGTTFLNKKTAIVRYMKSVERGGTQKPELTHWTATIIFKYTKRKDEKDSKPSGKVIDGGIDPLITVAQDFGFVVNEYRNDVDVVQSETTLKPFSVKKEYGASAGFEKQEGQQEEVKP